MVKSTRTPSENTQVALMAQDITYIKKSIDDLTDKVDHNYVSNEKFENRVGALERNLATVNNYGKWLILLILGAVVTAVLQLVLAK